MQKKVIAWALLVAGVGTIIWFVLPHTVGSPVITDEVKNIDDMKGGELAVVSASPQYFDAVQGFYAEPEMAGAYPGVILIHEWWGLNDNIKESAEKLASAGYRVLAVDLYDGRVATESSQARELTGTLDQARALQNLGAAKAYLESKGAERIASMGWCFGGGQSMQFSLSGAELDATVIYYGQLVTDSAELEKITWPVLGVFGSEDTSIPTNTVVEFRDTLTVQATPNEVYIYPGVGHAFANPSGANYAPEETADAWVKTLAFLEANLR